MSNLNPHERRRAYVKLGTSSSGVIWRDDRELLHSLSAYQLTCLRHLSPRAVLDSEDSRQTQIGHDVRAHVLGDVCYAFYARSTHRVKIGRTTNLPDRWRRLETASGALLQLLSVWHCADSRELEAQLFVRYAEHRTIGEWFKPEPVIEDLKHWTARRRWSLDGNREAA